MHIQSFWDINAEPTLWGLQQKRIGSIPSSKLNRNAIKWYTDDFKMAETTEIVWKCMDIWV